MANSDKQWVVLVNTSESQPSLTGIERKWNVWGHGCGWSGLVLLLSLERPGFDDLEKGNNGKRAKREGIMAIVGKVCDNSVPKHACKKAKEWSKNHQIKLMPWSAQSPDLNPIKHLWQHLKRRLGGHPAPPGGILELWGWVEKEWEAIPQSVCRDLVESMPRKIAAVIRAKGGYTKY